jgi:hypothetical protein
MPGAGSACPLEDKHMTHVLELDEKGIDRLHQLASGADDELDMGQPDEVFESIVSEAIAIWEDTQRNYWKMGDVARKCEKKHGKASLKSLAYSIGIKKTLMYDLQRTAAFFYHEDFRERFKTLKWGHYREVSRLEDKVLDELEVAMDLLAKAEDENWTVEKTAEEVNRLLGKGGTTKKKFFAAEAQIVEAKHAEHGMVHIVFEVAQDTDLDILTERIGEMVVLKVFGEPKDEPETDGDVAAEANDAPAQ